MKHDENEFVMEIKIGLHDMTEDASSNIAAHLSSDLRWNMKDLINTDLDDRLGNELEVLLV